MRVVVIGAGAGGLSSAIALTQAGHTVRVLEATPRHGGLAAGVTFDDVTFDGGPYVLLDNPGLEWVFERLGSHVEEHLERIRVTHPWQVNWPDGRQLNVYDDIDRTVDGFEAHTTGAGIRYRRFVNQMVAMYERLAPLQRQHRPKPWHMLTPNRLPALPFMTRPLNAHLRSTGLPDDILDALAIWTRISGQSFATAPAVMSLVPAIVHTHGAWVVRGGMRRIVDALYSIALACGVDIQCNRRVHRILTKRRRIVGVDTDSGVIEADRVIGNAAALSVLFDLIDTPVPAHRKRWDTLPLQSPGIGVYLTANTPNVPFITFLRSEQSCAARVVPGVVDSEQAQQVRLVAPLPHGASQEQATQKIRHLIDQSWWQQGLDGIQIRGTRTPTCFGTAATLYRDSMNPVMTQSFMRRGRIPHQIAEIEGLFLAGSATHPGQWVTFCAISGVLAAEALGQ